MLCRVFGYGAYLIFMFFVVVVLQSLLIVQMSVTFIKVQSDAKRAQILNKAKSILIVEETTNALKLSWISMVYAIYPIEIILQNTNKIIHLLIYYVYSCLTLQKSRLLS